MKKIDFHIHTVATDWDSVFTFDLTVLQRYVTDSGLDAIAITNHNKFDRSQFNDISDELSIPVFPGIEVSLDRGHILVIADPSNINEFEAEAAALSNHFANSSDVITVDMLLSIFKNLPKYLLIPHYSKTPKVPSDTLKRLGSHVVCGEVSSPKKFIFALKDTDCLTPVYFSDCRISAELDPLPTRCTFVDCGNITIPALKTCLQDKSKVGLSNTHGLFEVLGNGQLLSTGLNIVLGGRSTGKTHLLSQISELHENVKYIKQFELVEQDVTASLRDFTDKLGRNESRIAEQYLAQFKSVVDDIIDIDLDANDQKAESFIRSLHESASESDRQDVFSQAALYNAPEFATIDTDDLPPLIDAVRTLVDSTKYRKLIDKHINLSSLKELAITLIDRYRNDSIDNSKRDYVNTIMREIQDQLELKTAAPIIDNIDLFNTMLELNKVSHFNEIVSLVRSPAIITDEPFHKFHVVSRKGSFNGAAELKKLSGKVASFQRAFEHYDTPYEYLRELLQIAEISKADVYKFFARISYKILNNDRLEVSGGERSEFNLLKSIKNATQHDLLLIDEPESSFDNIFLDTNVNKLLKEIAETMPVVIVTHNSTVGASINPNYLLYTRKTIENDKPVFKVYSGHPQDRTLYTVDGESVDTLELMLDSLEAGETAYKKRGDSYEALKD